MSDIKDEETSPPSPSPPPPPAPELSQNPGSLSHPPTPPEPELSDNPGPSSRPEPLMGGLTSEQPANEKIQRMLEIIKDQVSTQLGFEPPEMTATHYRSQLCAGYNYFVRVRVGDGKHIHIRMYDRLFKETEISLSGIRHYEDGGVGEEVRLAYMPVTLSSDPEAILMTHMEEMMFLRTGSEAGVSMRSVLNSLIGVPIPVRTIQSQEPRADANQSGPSE